MRDGPPSSFPHTEFPPTEDIGWRKQHSWKLYRNNEPFVLVVFFFFFFDRIFWFLLWSAVTDVQITKTGRAKSFIAQSWIQYWFWVVWMSHSESQSVQGYASSSYRLLLLSVWFSSVSFLPGFTGDSFLLSSWEEGVVLCALSPLPAFRLAGFIKTLLFWIFRDSIAVC